MKLKVKINTESRTFYTEVTHFDTVCQTSVGFSFTFEALTSRSEVHSYKLSHHEVSVTDL